MQLSTAELAALVAGASISILSPVSGPSLISPPIPQAVSWVYFNGQFLWAGDWSFAGTPNYADKTGASPSGFADIEFTLSGQWGGWLPYAPNESFDTTPYTSLIFSFKPTVANQQLNVYFMAADDTTDGSALNPFQTVSGKQQFGPAPVAGVWGQYVLPLKLFALTNTKILKFSIHDETGLAANSWYVDAVGFQ